jgi:hypothetical protein
MNTIFPSANLDDDVLERNAPSFQKMLSSTTREESSRPPTVPVTSLSTPNQQAEVKNELDLDYTLDDFVFLETLGRYTSNEGPGSEL